MPHSRKDARAYEAAMRAKSFFYVSLGILALAAAYHLGASTAVAQAPGNPVVGLATSISGNYVAAAITANGDVYTTSISALDHGWTFRQNIFNGGATPPAAQSWGSLKARYR